MGSSSRAVDWLGTTRLEVTMVRIVLALTLLGVFGGCASTQSEVMCTEGKLVDCSTKGPQALCWFPGACTTECSPVIDGNSSMPILCEE